MFGLHLGSGMSKRVAVVDVGSASAAIGILEIPKKGPSTLISAFRTSILYEKRGKEQFAQRVGWAIEDAATKALAAVHSKDAKTKPISEVFVFFRAPWVNAEVIKLSQRFEKETKITSAHIDALEKQTVAGQSKLFEAVIMRLELNGYMTPSAIGKIGHMLTMHALVTTVEESLQRNASDRVSTIFPHVQPQWRSHTRALLTYVHESVPTSKNLVVVDIASEGTSIMVIKDQILNAQVSFDFGMHEILEKLSPGAVTEETLNLLRMLELEQCASSVCDQLRKNMEKVEQEMVRTFGEQLASLANKTRLPDELVLFVHPNMAPWLSRFFSKIDFAQFTVPLKPFSVTELTQEDLGQWIHVDNPTLDVSLLLATSLVHIEESQKS